MVCERGPRRAVFQVKEVNPLKISPFAQGFGYCQHVVVDRRRVTLECAGLSFRKQRFSAYPCYGRARCWPMLGSLKT